jgi:hypothetical protein
VWLEHWQNNGSGAINDSIVRCGWLAASKFSPAGKQSHKTDDGDEPNPIGDDRYLEGHLLTQALWLVLWNGLERSQLSTANYAKGGGRSNFGWQVRSSTRFLQWMPMQLLYSRECRLVDGSH